MEKEYKTMSFGTTSLKIDTGKNQLFPQGVNVKAHVDMDTGEVKLFIDPEDLKKLKWRHLLSIHSHLRNT